MEGLKKKSVLVIPARGGSKGIIKKNLKEVGGISLVGRSVLQARKASNIDYVIVSTDDEEIAQEAKKYGALVTRRPANISGDKSSSESAVLHAVEEWEKRDNIKFDVALLMQCTSPFTSYSDIEGTAELVLEKGYDSAFSAIAFHHFMWKEAKNGARGINHDGGERKMRQDLEPNYLESGSVYAFKVDSIKKEGHRFCGKTGIFEMAKERCFEIDEQSELDQARLIAPLLDRENNRKQLPSNIKALVFDFDGVFTDNRVITSQEGDESVYCSRSDGMGIELIRRNTSIKMLVISKEENHVVEKRCRKMKLPVYHGVDDKLTLLKRWLKENKISKSNLVYVGNDINDLDCLCFAACGVGPSDSHMKIIPYLDIILSKKGGNGAVRELADMILSVDRESK